MKKNLLLVIALLFTINFSYADEDCGDCVLSEDGTTFGYEIAQIEIIRDGLMMSEIASGPLTINQDANTEEIVSIGKNLKAHGVFSKARISNSNIPASLLLSEKFGTLKYPGFTVRAADGFSLKDGGELIFEFNSKEVGRAEWSVYIIKKGSRFFLKHKKRDAYLTGLKLDVDFGDAVDLAVDPENAQVNDVKFYYMEN